MRLRLAFKLHGEEADVARQIADAAGVEVDKLAKLALQRYLRDVLERASQLQAEGEKGNGQPSPTNADDAPGTVPNS